MKIGITGIANGGKTVFLTSLIWHLTELEHSNFSYSTKNLIENYKAKKKNSTKETIFPFDMYREKIAKARKWPAKTKASYTYSCTIERKDWKTLSLDKVSRLRQLQFSKKQELTFFDFPGERIADASIAAFQTYEEWSDHILNHFNTHLDYNEAIKPYLELLNKLCSKNTERQEVENQEVKEKINEKINEKLENKKLQKNEIEEIAQKLIFSYKLALAKLIHHYKPLISPSVFLLDETGSVAPMATEEELANSRFTGLCKDTQFIPLPSMARQALPELNKQMAHHYTNYRKQIAWPLFKKIIQSQRLVILIDIPSLLMGGVDRYNDSRQILHDLFEAIEPQSFLGILFQKLQAFIGLNLEKIAFVAVKSDLVRPNDVINGKLKNLLCEMTIRAKKMLPHVECGFFICSAVHSTREGKSLNHTIGTPLRNNPEQKEMEFMVSALPESWPERWDIGEYQFMEVAPLIPRNLMIPPKQTGLDHIFKFLL